MAKATLEGDVVTLKLSVEEALYVTAELEGGNSYFHGVQGDSDNWYSTPFAQLTELLRVGANRRGKHAARYRAHKRVAEACRPVYDLTAGRKAAGDCGLLEPEVVEA